ncbi:ABC transporter substrate-binding protein [Nocardioides sp. Y6]|uniref:ABC transporter substrate-binding protein n=1 Tax=Nocardioides malaquae TaxID=2773426 RepID=A0ABR9RS82_9ACTN|nr:ABC transporter substrate-binding protein [Nocardioides malaquae]MBE7324442.1 ABC transporter substrate-binding protein [Nocardioides malaquae]
MRKTAVRRRARIGAVGVAAAALLLTSCAESERNDEEASGGTFVFAGSDEPKLLDPAFASDGETFRVARQIFEGLVGTEPGTADPAPLLATEWENSEDGLEYTFTLRDDVKFHDGTDFDAEAVCFNFDRWYNFPESVQSDDFAYYYAKLFRGFAKGPKKGKGIYESCEATDTHEAKITLNAPFAGFTAALSLPALSMQSPTALEKYQDDAAANVNTTEYSTAHPTGTGPFVFDSWDRGSRVTLKRNDDYWGEKAKVDTVQVVAISDPAARATAVRNGDVDGADLIGPADLKPLEDEGMQVIPRAPFTVLYLGLNQKTKPLDDIRVRQAIAHAIDKDAVAAASLPEGSEIATQFMPQSVNGWSDSVTEYEYDPEKARDLLKEAGAEGATIEFNYPTDVSRPYMPSPEDTFNVLRSQLQEVGLKIKPVADVWTPDYLDKITGTANHGIHLLGWTGDYNDSDNFVGVFFGTEQAEWGFKNQELFDKIAEARGIPSVEEQTPLYEEINEMTMELLPGVPLAHPSPSLAFGPDVEGFQQSPVNDEVFNTVSVG